MAGKALLAGVLTITFGSPPNSLYEAMAHDLRGVHEQLSLPADPLWFVEDTVRSPTPRI